MGERMDWSMWDFPEVEDEAPSIIEDFEGRLSDAINKAIGDAQRSGADMVVSEIQRDFEDGGAYWEMLPGDEFPMLNARLLGDDGFEVFVDLTNTVSRLHHFSDEAELREALAKQLEALAAKVRAG